MKSSLKDAWRRVGTMLGILPKHIERDVNERRVKYYFRLYAEENDLHLDIMQLHHIEVKTRKHEIAVTVILGRPGLLIGKGGQTIDELMKFLSNCLHPPVKIEIQEYDVWS